MVALFTETWERGVNGAACTSGNTNFSGFIHNFTFSSTHVLAGQGSLCGHLNTTSANAMAQAPLPAGNNGVYFLSFALEIVEAPPATVPIANLRGTGTQLADLVVTAGRALAIRNSGYVMIASSPAGQIPVGAAGRVEWMLNTNTDQQRVRWFANPTGATPDYDSGLISTTAVGAATFFNFGAVNSTTWEAYFGDVVLDDTAWPDFGGGGGTGGTVAQRASATPGAATGTATSVSVTVPASGAGGTVAVGDLAILTFVGTAGPLTNSAPTGWTRINHQSSTQLSFEQWAKVLVSGDLHAAVAVTSNNTGNVARELFLDVFSGAQLGDVSSALASAATKAHTTPAVTAVDPNAWVHCGCADRGSPSSSAFALDSNLTQIDELIGTSGTSVSTVVCTVNNVGSGTIASDTITGTLATTNAVIWSVVLEPTTATIGQTVNAGSDQTVEPWVTVDVTATASGLPSSTTWTLISPTGVTLDLTGASTLSLSFPAPADIALVQYKLRCTATYAASADAHDDVLITVLPVTERFVGIDGVEVPLRSYLVE
jgi:hypothetical protein